MERAIKYLREHPEDTSKSARELSKIVGVSHTYIAAAKRALEKR